MFPEVVGRGRSIILVGRYVGKRMRERDAA